METGLEALADCGVLTDQKSGGVSMEGQSDRGPCRTAGVSAFRACSSGVLAHPAETTYPRATTETPSEWLSASMDGWMSKLDTAALFAF